MINKFLDNYEFYKAYEENGPFSNETIRKADRFLAIKNKKKKSKRKQRITVNQSKKKEGRECYENV